ncbi:MAG: hypothetical protein ACJ76D_01435 [Solirubrobacterales bacterium]
MDESASSASADIFVACAEAMAAFVLIRKISKSDKEFHFQNWVEGRIEDAGISHDLAGRNSYPDFTLVRYPEGYEVKGLGYPGREADYDANSRLPSGLHNGRSIFYVFGRYPAEAKEREYPVVDLVICHGDFLNANHEYEHKNRSFRGFGSYGDLLVRDRKMYVAPTPFALAEGTAGKATLITPHDLSSDDRLEQVGELTRIEAEQSIVGYTFDFRDNTLVAEHAPNPSAGKQHRFLAYRLAGASAEAVTMKSAKAVEQEFEEDIQ